MPTQLLIVDHVCPECGEQVCCSLETMQGQALIMKSVSTDPRLFEYEGSTEVLWDSQRSIRDPEGSDHVVLMCENGHEWPSLLLEFDDGSLSDATVELERLQRIAAEREVSNEAELREFLVVARYEDGDLEGTLYRAETPFEALLLDVQEANRSPRHDAATFLENACYEYVIFDVAAKRVLPWREIRTPWNVRDELGKQIDRLQKAHELLSPIADVSDIIGGEIGSLPLQLDAITTRLETLRAERQKVVDAWEAVKQPPPEYGKEQRSVDVDGPVGTTPGPAPRPRRANN